MVFGIEEIGGEGLDFELVLNKDQLVIDQAGLNVYLDVSLKGTLNRIDEDVYLKGAVTTGVIASCSRCLNKLSYPIDSEFKTHFVPSDDRLELLREMELHASDIDIEVYENQQIDLTQSIRDIILLAVPVICLCKEDCKGICFQCGKNLNQEFCQCSNDSFIDSRLKILKVLKDKFAKGG
jgi:uncharacterized protein